MTVALTLSAVAVGQNRSKMNLSTLQFLKEQQSEVKSKAQQSTGQELQYVDCFIRYSKPCKDALKALGVQVMVDVDGIMTARVPVAAMNDVVNLEEVISLNIGEKMNQNSDVARAATHVAEVQKGKENGLPLNYDGTGVVLGVIDGGIDFMHPAFRTEDGHSRFSAVYFPSRTRKAGNPPVIVNGNELPGVLYVNKSELDTLTCDDKNNSHGTHVLGIAAGRNIGLYGGVAPGVDLVACPLQGSYGETTILNGFEFLIDYAKKVGKPLVISKSLGTILGPHDGTSDFVQMQDRLLGDDVICCNSNGNAGDASSYIYMDGTNVHQYNNLYYHAFMARPWDGVAEKSEEVMLRAHVWCEDDKPFDIAFIHHSKTEGIVVKEVLKYEVFYENGSADASNMIDELGYAISASGQVNATNKKFHTLVLWRYDTNYKVMNYAAGLMILPRDKNQVMRVWFDTIDGCLMTNKEIQTNDLILEEGNTSLSANDLSSSPALITVGNYVTRLDYPVWLGAQTQTEQYENPVGSISVGSSYGTTLNGIKTPTVCGPGTMIVSAVNHFDSGYRDHNSATKQTVNGEDYYWAALMGTSMSTPHVSGIVALWLQANPRMKRKDIIDVLAKTSIPCANENEKERWGKYGRIDALAGLKYVLETSDVRSVEAENALLWTDVYNLNGQLIRKRVATETALEGLPAGIYVAGGKKVVVR